MPSTLRKPAAPAVVEVLPSYIKLSRNCPSYLCLKSCLLNVLLLNATSPLILDLVITDSFPINSLQVINDLGVSDYMVVLTNLVSLPPVSKTKHQMCYQN